MSGIEIALPNERQITLEPMLFGNWRLHVGRVGSLFFDDSW